jgi:hypothetical protein
MVEPQRRCGKLLHGVLRFLVIGIEMRRDVNARLGLVVYKNFAPSQFLGRFFAVRHIQK